MNNWTLDLLTLGYKNKDKYLSSQLIIAYKGDFKNMSDETLDKIWEENEKRNWEAYKKNRKGGEKKI
jgi:hypothetical protein